MIPPVRIDPSTANGAALTSPAPMTQLVPVPNSAGSYPPSSGGGYAINTPPSLSTPPSASLGTPAFDPYGTTTQGGLFAPPSAYPQTSTIPGTNPWGSIYGGTAGATTGYSMTGPGPYPTTTDPGVYGTMGGPSSYPPSAYPSSGPPVLFPGGFFGMPTGAGGYGAPSDFGIKLLQGPKFRHGWVAGGNAADDLSMHETSLAIALALPNFLQSGQPLYLIPSFGLDLWSGPSLGFADLPGSAYEGFVEAGWQTDPNQIMGLELGLSAGVYTDFDTFNSDSWRIQGKGLGKFRLTPYSTLKAGVVYLDRVDVKLLPAGGLLFQPNPFWRWDIYFPEPKVSHFTTTLGTQDVWCYLAGEYGGGSWTITRASGVEDRVDINDFRVLLGLEWGRSDLIRAGQRTGFAEIGWVFEREVLYENSPGSMSPSPSFMLRVGFGY